MCLPYLPCLSGLVQRHYCALKVRRLPVQPASPCRLAQWRNFVGFLALSGLCHDSKRTWTCNSTYTFPFQILTQLSFALTCPYNSIVFELLSYDVCLQSSYHCNKNFNVVFWFGGAQNPGARLSGWQTFVRWCLIFLGPGFVTCCVTILEHRISRRFQDFWKTTPF